MQARRWYAWLLVVATMTLAAGVGLATSRLGLHAYVVRTGSMVPALHPGDVIIDRPPTVPHVGQVATFRITHGQVVTHRVVSAGPHGIRTKGDANRTADPWQLRPADLVGRLVAVIPKGGMILVYLRQPTGVASLVSCVLALLFAWQMFFGQHSQESRSRHVSRSLGITAMVLPIAALVVATHAAKPSGATFSDSRFGAITGTQGHGHGSDDDGDRPRTNAFTTMRRAHQLR